MDKKEKLLTDIYALYLMKLLTVCEHIQLIAKELQVPHQNINYVVLARYVIGASKINTEQFHEWESKISSYPKEIIRHYPYVKILLDKNIDVQILLFQISEYITTLKFLHNQQDNFNDVMDAIAALLNLNINI
jgi:hypothetical protein